MVSNIPSGVAVTGLVLDYLRISKFDAESTRSDFLMDLPTLVIVNMVLRVLSEDRKIHR